MAGVRPLLKLLTVVTMAVASCTGGDEGFVNDRSPSSRPSLDGGTLRVVIPRTGESQLGLGTALDPQKEWWTDSFEVFRCCLLRTLLAHPGLRTEDGGTELHPDLASRTPDISGDGLTWTFHLRDSVEYGPPLEDTQIVAGDIIRALEREATVASGGTYAFYYSIIEGFDAVVRGDVDSISGLEAPDDSTLVVHLTHPAGVLANLFAMPATAPIPPVGSKRFGVADGVDGYGRFLVSSGPYMIEGSEDLDLSVPPGDRDPISGYVPEVSLTLVRNPSWERETDVLRPAYVDRIEVTMVGGIGEAVRLVQAGEADLYLYDSPAPQVPIDVVQRLQEHPELGVGVHVESATSFASSRSTWPSHL